MDTAALWEIKFFQRRIPLIGKRHWMHSQDVGGLKSEAESFARDAVASYEAHYGGQWTFAIVPRESRINQGDAFRSSSA